LEASVKVAISNIAWDVADDRRVAALIYRLGGKGVEVAPTKHWERPVEASAKELMEYRHQWESEHLEIVALQALFYGQEGLALFGGDEARVRAGEYLDGIIRVGGMLGAGALVFGSPKNRLTLGRPAAEIEAIAVSFFRAAANTAERHGTTLCIEANPAEYGADFVTNVAEARSLVGRVGRPGFGLHLDTGGMLLAGEDIPAVVRECGDAIRHFHVSEPYLAPVDQGRTDHGSIADALRSVGYRHWVSIEMRPDPDRDVETHVGRSLERIVAAYGD
jgi:D-psicose/D-tagatose/L-ribulose 3-epimerase